MSTTSGALSQERADAGETVRTQQRWDLPEAPERARLPLWCHRPILLASAPAVVYLAIRSFGLLVLAWLSAANGESLADNLGAWDGEWYLEIAAHGYGGVDPSMVDGYGNRYPETPLAFFPGYPLLIQLFTLTGLDVSLAAVIVSMLAGVACAYGLARLGRRVGGTHGVGLLLVALFAASPMSVVLSIAYSEALFCALAVWALNGVIERNWLLAGLCCAASGLVRPTASALIVTVSLAALVAVAQRRDSWRPWAATMLAPTGMMFYIGWVALQTGKPGGYFELQQRGWSSAFDGGVATLKFGIETLAEGKSVLENLTVWISLASLVLMVLCLRSRIPWPLPLFAFLVLAMDLGSNGLMYSKVRLMLPAFPLLIPIAVGLANQRTTTAVSTTLLLVFFGSWFGAYSLTTWPYAM